jgi:DNA-directed RNA polymerase specialized sigma24 family protein
VALLPRGELSAETAIVARKAPRVPRFARRRAQDADGEHRAQDHRSGNRVDRATVHEVLGRLHWRERRELLLYAHGFSYREIAQVTDTSYTAVNRWMARGRKALRNDRACRELGRDQGWPAR